MNPALTIAKKEYSLSLRSFGTYIIFGVFLLASGVWFALTALKLQVADLRDIFSKMQILFLFFIPALTMGSIARERANGTLELVSTLPLKLSHIVWGKFLSVWLQVATVLVYTLVFPVLVAVFGVGMDLGAVFTGYLGLLCSAAALVGIGIFASSLTDNQVIGFITALAISGFLFLLGHLGDLIPLRLFSVIEYLGFDYHLNSFVKGVIDTRDLLWFAAVSFIFVLLAQLRLQAENLRQEK
ncbi:MAG: ABC transporter permease [Candidatus Cloacimonetes bacterium]|nr:ABC transporter permease [Candidatus Cloacimonadota bacterium]